MYQFISDPTHKENLSGRVTAACLNCRRKKIKCSGHANCRQCQDKGLTCEGPPTRKRPKRDHVPIAPTAATTSASALSSYVNGTGHAEIENDDLRSEEAPPLIESDSGYASIKLGRRSRPDSPLTTASNAATSTGATSTPSTASSREPQTQWTVSSDFSLYATTRQPAISEGTTNVDTTDAGATSPFAFNVTYTHPPLKRSHSSDVPHPQSTVRTYYPTAMTDALNCLPAPLRMSTSFDVANNALSTRMPTSSDSPSHGSFYSMGDEMSRRNSSYLLKTASLLENEALQLRRMAHRQDDRLRDGFDEPLSLSHITPSADRFARSLCDTAMMQGLDNIFRADGSLRTGFTPTATDYLSWLDHREHGPTLAPTQSLQYHPPAYTEAVGARTAWSAMANGNASAVKREDGQSDALNATVTRWPGSSVAGLESHGANASSGGQSVDFAGASQYHGQPLQ